MKFVARQKSTSNMSNRVHTIKCFKPFGENICSKEVRKLSISTIDKLKTLGYAKVSTLNSEFHICSACRLQVDRLCTSSEEQCVAASSQIAARSQFAASSQIAATAVLSDVLSAESLLTVPSAISVSTDQRRDADLTK